MCVPRMVSLRSDGMPCQSSLCPSTIARHCARASSSDKDGGMRWASSVRIAPKDEVGGVSGMRRIRRLRMSPARQV